VCVCVRERERERERETKMKDRRIIKVIDLYRDELLVTDKSS
jgi:hypothetical protein